VSEQILNDTSSQLGYKVPVTSVYARRKIGDRRKIKNRHCKKDNPEKAPNRNYC